jgi:hypothetical protein
MLIRFALIGEALPRFGMVVIGIIDWMAEA